MHALLQGYLSPTCALCFSVVTPCLGELLERTAFSWQERSRITTYVFHSTRKDKSPSRCIQIGAAWAGDKGQLNVKIEESRNAVAEFIRDGYDIVFFEKSDAF
jgi:hypothetical protein